ncbi:Mitochondrial chaperone Frataxin [Gamsiella multidivaricata]|nr:Mitochondrial chaperone Frataxin [Gamsiella multidivaricata]
MSPTTALALTRALISRARPGQLTTRQLSHAARYAARFSSTVSESLLARTHIRHTHGALLVTKLSTAYTFSRLFSSSKQEQEYAISELSNDDYHSVSDACMNRMVEYFEDLGDEHEIPGYDVEYQSGVMTLKLGDKGTYVVNKQPPNKQLWLSSPTTGPKRYDYDTTHKTWFYGRDHHSLKYLLDTEISEATGIDIDVPLDGLDNE